ncbi:Uncharacterized protein Adt_21097 [Abeliophyllum distichum]|uniref:Uncharacterized protein n=1 Tax=Abeliophyllum distichum TaxID=126358 RepID=A0ABD1SYE7_9LAMI
MFDCRELVRGRMDLNDFCWNPIHLPPQCGIRTDKDDRSTEISEFMTSIRPGFLSYRRGSSSYILEAYNPHRFGRQQGFRQKLPGSPKDMNLVINPINLYCAWLSLTQVGSGCSFHILGRTNNIQNQVDSAYEDWWNSEVFPRLNKIQMKELLSSEDKDFGLEQPAPIPKHTKNDNAKDINPSRAASQRTFQKRALDIPDDGGPKRLKFTFPSTRNILSSERVEKIPGTILVSEDSNFGDQASRGLEATLVPEDSSSEDQNNENLDIIDALDGIDGLNGSKDLPCDYPSHISGGILASKLADINDEGESSPTLEERDQQLESLNSRIDVEMAIFSSLESKIGQLASELDKLRDELQTRKENLDKMEDARITLEQAQVRNIANVKSIDQEKEDS